MVRVPNTISLRSIGLEPTDQAVPLLPLHTRSDRKVGDLIRLCTPFAWQRLLRGLDKKNLAGFVSTMALLLEIRDIYPDRRPDIDSMLVRNGYSVPQS